jgi:DNA-binding winged helix-turn-helix (wHTH) protein
LENRIGQWIFDADRARLTGEGGERRLEDRAARTLALLCERRGEVVTREEILAVVWSGRAVSENSVAVVMRDLRKALDDDARSPRFIETVAKRGYRLALDDVPARRKPIRMILAGAALALAAIAAVLLFPSRPAVVMTVTPVLNETGQDSYEPLARALTQVVIDETARLDGVTLSETNARLRLDGRLILWNGVPALSVSVSNPATGHVVWTGMAEGGQDVIAKLAAARLDELGRRLRHGAGLDE